MSDTIELPTDPMHYCMSSNGKLYHLLDVAAYKAHGVADPKIKTYCGQYTFSDTDVITIPTIVPRRTKLVCKRCLLSMGINKQGEYNAR